MKFHLTVLGSNSALPAHGRNPSAQVLHVRDTPYLVDCGEGTQIRLRQFGVKFMRINHIFITHLHGDHVFGLPGLVNSFGHHGRKEELHIYGPEGIEEFLETILRLSQSRMEFRIQYHVLTHQNSKVILRQPHLRVAAFPLKHRIATYGFRFDEVHSERNVRQESIAQFDLSWHEIRDLKAGMEVLRHGEPLPREDLLEPPKDTLSFCYCSDTRYDPDLVPHVQGCTLLYHEATFLHDAVSKAEYSMHSTAREAAQFATLSSADSLLIGHFSSRYADLSPLLDEARSIFPASYLAIEGQTFPIPIEEENKSV